MTGTVPIFALIEDEIVFALGEDTSALKKSEGEAQRPAKKRKGLIVSVVTIRLLPP